MIPILAQIQATYRFISFEPLPESIDFYGQDGSEMHEFWQAMLMDTLNGVGSHINQIIIGCERKRGNVAGRFQDGFMEAARDLIRQADEAGIKVHVKQAPINGKVVTKLKEFPKEMRRRDEL